jgi:hypothetical protein
MRPPQGAPEKKLGDTEEICFAPQAEYRQPGNKRAVADELDDALCRLQREFLNAKRHEDDNHDPAEDRQQAIRSVAFFGDIESCFHVDRFFPFEIDGNWRVEVAQTTTQRQRRRYVLLQFLNFTMMCMWDGTGLRDVCNSRRV